MPEGGGDVIDAQPNPTEDLSTLMNWKSYSDHRQGLLCEALELVALQEDTV